MQNIVNENCSSQGLANYRTKADTIATGKILQHYFHKSRCTLVYEPIYYITVLIHHPFVPLIEIKVCHFLYCSLSELRCQNDPAFSKKAGDWWIAERKSTDLVMLAGHREKYTLMCPCSWPMQLSIIGKFGGSQICFDHWIQQSSRSTSPFGYKNNRCCWPSTIVPQCAKLPSYISGTEEEGN